LRRKSAQVPCLFALPALVFVVLLFDELDALALVAEAEVPPTAAHASARLS
jgi:hypothetical protein